MGNEVKQFEEDWKLYWIPTITDEQIESGRFSQDACQIQNEEYNDIMFQNVEKDTYSEEEEAKVVAPHNDEKVKVSKSSQTMEDPNDITVVPLSNVREEYELLSAFETEDE